MGWDWFLFWVSLCDCDFELHETWRWIKKVEINWLGLIRLSSSHWLGCPLPTFLLFLKINQCWTLPHQSYARLSFSTILCFLKGFGTLNLLLVAQWMSQTVPCLSLITWSNPWLSRITMQKEWYEYFSWCSKYDRFLMNLEGGPFTGLAFAGPIQCFCLLSVSPGLYCPI